MYKRSKNFFVYALILSVTCISILAILYFLNSKKAFLEISKSTAKPILKVKTLNHYSDEGGTVGLLHDALNKKFQLKYVQNNYDIIIESVFGDKVINAKKDVVRILFTSEPYLPKINNYDLVIGFDHIDDPSYIRIPYYYYGTNFVKHLKSDYNRENDQGPCKPEKKYFACFLVTNGSTGNFRDNTILDGVLARDKLFKKLSSYKFVASGGKHLNNIGKPVALDKTAEWLSDCKFIIAYENQSHNGYITEKPFQAYAAGAIPIYYSDLTAVSDVNKKALIYAKDFKTEKQLIKYIKKVDRNDELYCKIWNEKIVLNSDQEYENVLGKLENKLYSIIVKKRPDLKNS